MNLDKIAIGALYAVAAAAVFGLLFLWEIVQWFECRDMGHSIIYCIAHIS